MPNVEFQYTINFHSSEGEFLGRRQVTPDWGPGRDWAKLEAVRQGMVRDGDVPGPITIEPIWSASEGQPQVEKIRFVFGEGPCQGFAVQTAVSYLHRNAQAAMMELLDNQNASGEKPYQYRICAFPAIGPNLGEPAAPAPPVNALSFGLTEKAMPSSDSSATGTDYPVFFENHIVPEVKEITEAASPNETGGILVGKLYHDPGQAVVFAEVSAQIPARHVEASETSLAFTPETWSHARNALRLRKRGEIILGWWHSHPVKDWCKDCPPEKKKKCPLLVDFFSSHDRHLHRTAFPGAHSIALVVNQLAEDHQTTSLFGWQQGILCQREFQIQDGNDARIQATR